MPASKANRLKKLISSPEMITILEAHNALSARIAEEAGFPALWASSLTLSASLGVRDNNEASWTQIGDLLEFMCDATTVPILVDGDTGYGNFNNFRRVVRKLENRGVAGICIEDKVFPKTNSFLRNGRQPLEDTETFCSKIRAGCDTRADEDFALVARTEALITGWGVEEALLRCAAYADAGADAVIVHSANPRPDEIFQFLQEWRRRLPVILIPTKYYHVPPEQFRQRGVSALIWANHLLRTAISAMQNTARMIREAGDVIATEESVAPLSEVFRLQGDDELRDAEKRYLPSGTPVPRAVILAATRGSAFENLTSDRPKTMLPVAGVPLIERICRNLRNAGIEEIRAVVGYCHESVQAPGLEKVVNPDWESTGEAGSLYTACEALEGPTLILFGDMLCRPHIFHMLLADPGDIVLAVERHIRPRTDGKPLDLVIARAGQERLATDPLGDPLLDRMEYSVPTGDFDGEWIGALKTSAEGTRLLSETLMAAMDEPGGKKLQMADLFNRLVRNGASIRLLSVHGHWTTVETMNDLLDAQTLE